MKVDIRGFRPALDPPRAGLFGSHAAAAVGVRAVVPHQVLALVRDVLGQLGQKVEDIEDLEVTAGARALGDPDSLRRNRLS